MSITFTSCWAGVIMCQRSSAGLPGCTSEFEYAFGIGSQEELAGLLVEIVLVESVQALQRRPGRMVGAEQHLVAAVTAEEGDDLGRIARGDVGGGVDVDLGLLGGERDHLRCPRVADVTTDDRELWEVERHTVQVGDWAPGLGLAQRAGVSDLEAERNIEFTA